MTRSGSRSRRRGSGQARRPRQPVTRRLRARLPSAARAAAFLAFVGLLVGGVVLVNGPWLRVARVSVHGAAYTPADALVGIVDDVVDTPVLVLRSDTLSARVAALPAVAEARVDAQLTGELRVTITEKPAAWIWDGPASRVVVAADGAVIGELDRAVALPEELASLPTVTDERSASRDLAVGSALPIAELRSAERLLGLDPELIGSRATHFSVTIDEEYGFVLVADEPGWRAAFGFYQLDPGESEATAAARFDQQVRAVRTLFATHSEGAIGWLDARNPGKVYWAP